MSGVIRWEEPPSTPALRAAARAREWAATAAALRKKRGEWAVIREGSIHGFGNIVTYIRKGSGPFAPEGSFEALQRTNQDRITGSRTGKVYARYIGDPS